MKKHLLVSACILLSLTGCAAVTPDNPSTSGYATQNQLTALEYSLYVGKQIQIFINEISSRRAVATTIQKGTSVDNEIVLTDSGIKHLKESLSEMQTVYPSFGSDDERESLLLSMQTAIDHMDEYKEALSSGNDLEEVINNFTNDFNQLTGLASLYNQ